ncbi:MAG: isoleucine--tRNA ligase [Spirochaetota bacterium]|nr:MAG: isoleucine--tRNA ligase [Spirochaetota bacterium]
MSYDNTLFLPKTGFPMRAGLAKKEPEILKRWEHERIYEKLIEHRKGNTTFILHDGPPYANGKIHIGTAYNKVLKDFIVKYKSMIGFYSPYVPGWDTHGLPIETEVIKAYRLDRDSLSPIDFRKKCKEFTSKYIQTMTEQFKRLGVWGDWDDPYITFYPRYEAKQIEIFGEMAKKHYIYKGLKPVYWCTTCITALADAEVEYHDHTSPSIYVKFKVKDGKHRYDELKGAYALIWTTTPWTLPGNTACALHPEYEYTLLESGGERYLVATQLLKEFQENTGVTVEKTLKQYKGSDLEGVVLRHPFIDRDSTIVFADYVTLDTGTGIVHTAPGHGMEDYETSLKYNLEIVSPLDDYGKFTDEVPLFEGMFCQDANKSIISHLKEIGVLLGRGDLTHSYPHCWRCKNPVIFRATEQWFTSIDGFRNDAINAIDNVSWIPGSSINRIKSMVENRTDWCISRQRTWGVPLPIFYCTKCGKEIINDVTLKAVIELFSKEGSDSWFVKEAEEILPKGFKCPHCDETSFTKEKDIMDVWFDSGTSHAAVLETRPELYWPADLYLEGSDQHRGWFQSSLLTAVAARGSAPYRFVLTHGFTVDGEGKKMSKSLGNTVDPEEVVHKYGADILRLWVVASDYSVDVRVSPEILDQLIDAYRKIRNTIRFMLGNLSGFNPKTQEVPLEQMEAIDRWLLHRLQEVTKSIKCAYETWQFHTIIQEILNFCTIDLSSFYLDIVKDRLYCSGPTKERRSAQTVINITLNGLLKLLAPVLVFTTEEAYATLREEIYTPYGLATEQSIHLADFPDIEEKWIDPKLAEIWNTLLAVRKDVLKPIELLREQKIIGHSLESVVHIYAAEETFSLLSQNREELAPLFVVSEVHLHKDGKPGNDAHQGELVSVEVEKSQAQKCNRCWKYEDTVGRENKYPDLCERCARVVTKYYS